MVHYPLPPHKQQAYGELNDRTYRISERIHREILSLPMSPVMSDEEVRRVVDVLNAYSL
jgi:dTDP-4-amino-4,6-dideoxygalactose transaminase